MKRGYSIIIATDQDIKASSAELLLEKRVDGIIFASFIDHNIILKYKNMGIPLVLLNNSVDLKDVSFVKVDNYSGAYKAVVHLISKNHKDIGFLCGPLQHRSYMERYQGYLAALKDHGIPVQEKFMRFGDSTLYEGTRLMNSILNSGDIPTAIFASNDMMAIGAIKAIKKAGLKIPDDVAIVGFDDIEHDVLIEPALSTVFVDKNKMGEMAVDLLLNEIVRNPYFKKENILPTKLILREST
jgi:DNA-binding LacI/PurR family transcriptional regulator